MYKDKDYKDKYAHVTLVGEDDKQGMGKRLNKGDASLHQEARVSIKTNINKQGARHMMWRDEDFQEGWKKMRE